MVRLRSLCLERDTKRLLFYLWIKMSSRRSAERLRLSRKRRKRKQFSKALGPPFTCVVLKNSATPPDNDLWQRFSMGETVIDGLGGTWNAQKKKNSGEGSNRQSSDAAAAAAGSYSPPAKSSSAGAIAVKLRTPRKLGSLNLLTLYSGDLISVIGSCDPNGHCKAPIERTIVVEEEKSATTRKSTKKNATMTRNKQGDPVHNPLDDQRWWYGTLLRSGRALDDEGPWPTDDRRQRTGRFPQSNVALHKPGARVGDLSPRSSSPIWRSGGSGVNGWGGGSFESSWLKDEEEEEEEVERRTLLEELSRCEVCGVAMKKCRGSKSGNTSQRLLAELNVLASLPSSSTFLASSSWDSNNPDFGMEKNEKKEDDNDNRAGSSSSGGVFNNVCASCVLKVASVCRSVARTSLLKPTASMAIKALRLTLPPTVNERDPSPPTELRRGSLPTSPRQRNDGGSRSQRAPVLPHDAFMLSDTGEEIIVAEIKSGPLGIEFNQEGEIKKILRGTQSYNIRGLSKGDRLSSIGVTSVVGFTTSEMLNVFKRRERPVTMTFVRHKEWPRGENDLPDINMEILSNLFDKHDKSKIASLSAVQFASFMSEIHELCCNKDGREIEHDFFPANLAKRLIDAHDDNGDERLDLDELNKWLSKGLAMSKEERKEFKNRGGYCLEAGRFIEEIAVGLQWIPEEAPEW